MKKKMLITIAVLVFCGLGVALISFAALQYSNVVSTKILMNTGNTTGRSGTIGVNTRPNVASAYVSITKTTGAVSASKYFPSGNSVTSLTSTVPSGEIRQIRIRSSNGRAIRGTLKYNKTY